MIECPKCHQESKTLTIPLNGKLGCPSCNERTPVRHNCLLGQVVDSYTRRDGSKGRITTGKAWEMEQRRICHEDKKVVLNKATGKETQY